MKTKQFHLPIGPYIQAVNPFAEMTCSYFKLCTRLCPL